MPSYAIAAAHVFDFADRSDYVEISAGLLLLNGQREGLPVEEKQNFNLGTSATVSVVGDDDAVQLGDLVVNSPNLVSPRAFAFPIYA